MGLENIFEEIMVRVFHKLMKMRKSKSKKFGQFQATEMQRKPHQEKS